MSDNEVVCFEGFCNFDEISFKLQPLQTIDMSVEIQVDEENGIEKEFEKSPIIFKLASRACEPGERLTDKGECLVCREGQYLLEPVTEVTLQCNDCISEAYCKGGNKISPRAGYWRANLTSDNFVKCLREQSCLSTQTVETVEQYLAKCDTGY